MKNSTILLALLTLALTFPAFALADGQGYAYLPPPGDSGQSYYSQPRQQEYRRSPRSWDEQRQGEQRQWQWCENDCRNRGEER